MPTYTSPPAPASPSELPDRPRRCFAIGFQRPQPHLSKAELRAMAAEAFANAAKMKPVKKDGWR